MMNNLYFSTPTLTCFDGDDVTLTPEQQQKINNVLAEQKRSHRAQLTRTERQLAELTESKTLGDQERAQLEETLEEMRQQLRTKEENEKIARTKLEEGYKKEIASLKKRAEDAAAKHRNTTIQYALHDAAVAEDAFNPAVLVTVLRDRAKLNVEGEVVVEHEVTDPETGKTSTQELSPADVVRQMKSDPERFGGLFKANVIRDVPPVGDNGKVDVRKLSTEQYMRLRKENPGALGL